MSILITIVLMIVAWQLIAAIGGAALPRKPWAGTVTYIAIILSWILIPVIRHC
jgi:hypothetical protein